MRGVIDNFNPGTLFVYTISILTPVAGLALLGRSYSCKPTLLTSLKYSAKQDVLVGGIPIQSETSTATRIPFLSFYFLIKCKRVTLGAWCYKKFSNQCLRRCNRTERSRQLKSKDNAKTQGHNFCEHRCESTIFSCMKDATEIKRWANQHGCSRIWSWEQEPVTLQASATPDIIMKTLIRADLSISHSWNCSFTIASE